MNMADRIQYLRKIKGISQEELADKVWVSRQAVSKWEREQSTPDLNKVTIMSKYSDGSYFSKIFKKEWGWAHRIIESV